MCSGITGDSENGNDLFSIFLEITTFVGNDLRKSRDAAPNGSDFQEKVITSLAAICMIAFSHFWQPFCNNKKHFERTRCSPRHTCRSSMAHQGAAAHSLGNTALTHNQGFRL